MFGLKRFLFGPRRLGVSDGDRALLELLDMNLLSAEAETAAFAGAAPGGRLKQARIHRELARRGGDAVRLRRAASSAELAATDDRTASPAEARLEQALCAMDGADMYGDDGLYAAAARVLGDIAGKSGPLSALASGKRAQIAARQALDRGAPFDALAALTAFDAITNQLRPLSRDALSASVLAECRIDRVEMTLACAHALQDDRLASRAAADLAEVASRLNAANQPLTWARAIRLRAEALTFVGQGNADLQALSNAVEELARLFDVVLKDHSPLDWARAQMAHGEALWAMAEITGAEKAFSQASGAFDRAWSVLRNLPDLRLRAFVGERRGALAVRVAEVTGERLEFDAAEAAFRCELAQVAAQKDPVAWALCQLNLARVYLARDRAGLGAQDGRARAAVAYSAAIEVLEEQGQGSLLQKLSPVDLTV